MVTLAGTHWDRLDFTAGARRGRRGRVIRVDPRTGERHLDWLTLGLLPGSADDPDTAPRPIQARAEKVTTHPMFADAFRRRRAIVPARGYFQRATKGEQGRYVIIRGDGQPMAIAGLWEAFFTLERETIGTYCVITTGANAVVAQIHDRMPLVLEQKDWSVWLGEVSGDPAALLRPPADHVVVLRPLLPS
jgi:putative SOS response-associated peptidase YedK